ncbi:MAG: lysophospholipid acyltransferase family protein [Prevotellaceae bacterium]|nr:lysophospholipid acyltransferase family protein [Prevotellaceae bacterium]
MGINNRILETVVYYFFYLISLLPLRVLYLLADIECFFVKDVIRYRRGIVRRNLVSSFPEKDLREIKVIEKRFYHWFCDYFFETIKLLSISEEELRRRFTIVNNDLVADSLTKGQNVAAILGHYCNWEWLSCVGIELPDNCVTGMIYHPLRNKAFDDLFRRIRSRERHAVAIPKKDILRYLIDYRRRGIPNIFGYISDQGPKWENIHLWLPFLNHPETPVFTGGEKIMRKMHNKVVYVEMSRPHRGYYTCTYRLLADDAVTLPENEITRRFFRHLEATIRREPAYYLWTHNRWKRTKEEFDRRFTIVHGKVVEKR